MGNAMERIQLDRRAFERCGYAVIDPLQVDLERLKRFPLESLAPATHAEWASQLPYALHLNTLGVADRDDLFVEIVDRESAGEEPLFCLLIESSHTPGSVIRHLRRATIVHSPAERKPYHLRYHDAYTLMQLCWILDKDQRKVLMGPSSAWLFPLERWRRLRPDAGALVTPGLRLRDDQWQQLQRVGTINVALERLGTSVDQRTAFGKQLDSWLVFAGAFGLTDEEDTIAFAMQGVTRHPEFHRHRIIARILAQCEGRPRRYSRVTLGLSEADWQRIATDLSSPSV
ncbi:hypothetical protein WL71_33245 [Burkholderia ubonensis]|uniref:DUF4123 domain-containing protein n=2 Tax=Burkholderia ubonensis TaxID=101571 RepID=A0A107EEA6_9BURK|nr:hypothetical protein WL71_33245 [Burkholderia ubonensis]KWD81057.1 hypothetical protein WL70_01675 [Burkholderia ubonensis]KWD91272.1 hypothetical protein WL72_30305 [Burkholderia ubonensis]KWE01523.1 hypothetical protein WL73_00070 [Burkholderia ubonensis]KWN20364.1 hypothetical protein WM21_03950 [Burkholderia ubonensis]